jgi:hypothetical protein
MKLFRRRFDELRVPGQRTYVDRNMDEIIDNLEPCVLTITGETSGSSDF